jgi:glycosyltransferase involved in cell wall biosynthesis
MFYRSVKTAPMPNPSNFRGLTSIRLSLSARTTSPDIVHLVGTNALAFAPVFKLTGRSGRIVRHVFTSYDAGDRAIRPLRWLTNTLFIDSYAFTTPQIGEWAQEDSPRTRKFLVRPPINCDLYRPLNHQPSASQRIPGQRTVLYMGPLWGTRFPAGRVMAAMKHLSSMGIDARLLILTSAKRSTQADSDKLQKLATSIGLEERFSVRRVDLTEEERVEAYNDADVIIFPYVGPVPERLADPPFGILEAMACGRIVLATDVLSISEVLTDGETGFLARDSSADEIARGIRRALTTHDGAEMGRAARQRIIADFSYPKVCDTLLESYSSLAI